MNCYERIFKTLLDERNISYEMEYHFHHHHFTENDLKGKPCNSRFDFCIPDKKMAFELEGGVWSKGRHVRPRGFIKDCIKYNLATSLGWSVYRFPTTWLETEDLTYITNILDGFK